MKRAFLFPILIMAFTACGQDAKIVQGPPGTSVTGTQGPEGPAGPPGEPAPTPSNDPNPADVVSEIIPCGRKYSDDEILQVRADGQVQAVLDRYGQAYLDILAPGTYWTSDRKHCKFVVHSDNSVTW